MFIQKNQIIAGAFRKPIDARLAKLYLEGENIHSELVDEHTVAIQPLYSPAIGGVKLLVDSSDYEHAMTILDGYFEKRMRYREHVESQCPACQSQEINRNTLSRSVIILLCILTANPLWLLLYKDRRCKVCKHVW